MKNYNSIKRSVLSASIVAALGLSFSAHAGNNNGVLKGSVLDGQDKPVAGATIKATNPKTGFSRTTTADENGEYRFGSLPIGTYDIVSSKNGFQDFTVNSINIRIGDTMVTIPMSEEGLEKIEVRGSAVAIVDTSSSEASLNIGAVELARIPMARNLTSVAMLAPGTTQGDARFGNYASFGGASVAENAYFINGLNTTNFRNGLGGSTVPYEFYKEFQVKTGGYSAEFGRSTGGVINAVTKSGSNDWEFGANLIVRPDSLRENSPNIRNYDGSILTWNEDDSSTTLNANVYVSGPIIEDTLFFYVLYNPRDLESESISGRGTQYNITKQDDAFWGAKIDWNISENHLVEFTGFSDKRTIVSNFASYEMDTKVTGDLSDDSLTELGGENISLKYTGYITDELTISALIGKNEADNTAKSPFDETCPYIRDDREQQFEALGCWATGFPSKGSDSRTAMRIDGEWELDDHLIRFGYDKETNESIAKDFVSGNIYYRYYNTGNTGNVFRGVEFDEATDVVRVLKYETGGEFETLSTAFYLEDVWTVSDEITARIGLRNESFNNKNAAGESFIKVENQWAPRLGITWDIGGEGDSKIYANWGRYHLPIAANTNIRMSGGELYTTDYYVLNGLNSDDTPIYDEGTLFSSNVYGDGSVPDVRSVLDQTIKPMYQDEIILGYQTMLSDNWSVGVQYTNRDLVSIIDDITIDKVILANNWHYDHNHYVLTNPGTNIEAYYDTDGDGTVEPISIDAADLGYPTPSRQYHEITFNFERAWDGVWSLRGSYTWAHSYGNAEGYVKSDNAQTDAGLTTDWDFPELMDGAYGNLPNDRRHQFKVFGAYQLTDHLLLGTNINVASGRPMNIFGRDYPSNEDWGDYGYGQTYYVGDTFLPRGSGGRTPWTINVDMNMTYQTTLADVDTTLRLDVFNVFNAQTVTRYDENAQSTFGTTNPEYGLPGAFQPSRRVMLSASFRY